MAAGPGVTMNVPSAEDPRWRGVVTREKGHAYAFLALNLLLTGASLSLRRGPYPATLDRAIQDVRALLERNAHLASVQHDLALIFGED